MKKEIQNTKKRVGIFNSIYSCSIIFLFMCSIGCSKSEDAIEGTRFTLLTLNTITVDSMRLSVTENGELLTDSLITPLDDLERAIKYKDPLRRYKVIDLYSKTVLFDSTIRYQNVFNNSITFFQPVAGGKLVQVTPPVNELAPHKDSIKISVVYSIPSTDAIYDQVKVVVEQSKDGSNTYVPKDSFLLKRGEFSPFYTGTKQRNPVFKFYTTDASRVLVSTTFNRQFTDASPVSIYYLNLKSSTSAIGTKLY